LVLEEDLTDDAGRAVAAIAEAGCAWRGAGLAD